MTTLEHLRRARSAPARTDWGYVLLGATVYAALIALAIAGGA